MSYLELSLDLAEDHAALRDSVRRFAIEQVRPTSLLLDKMTPEEVIAPGSPYWTLMKKMYELGYHTVLIPDAYGGLGLDPIANHIFWEEMAYGSVGLAVSLGCAAFGPFICAMMAEDELTEAYITPFVECRDASVMSCWGITEPNHGSDNLMPGGPQFFNPKITQQVKAAKKGDQFVLSGQKSAWISNGTIASNSMLFCNMDPSMGLAGGGICLVDLTQAGVSRGKPLDKLGQRDLPQGEVYFDEAVVPAGHFICDQESYTMITDMVVALANAHMGAFFTGVARSAYDLALQYSTERVQGGKRLCEHPTIQRRLFDMFSKIEASRYLSRAAMVYNMSTTPPNTKYSIASKVFCTQAAFEVASDALQIFGGYGLTKEYPIEKIFRDARAGLIEDGANDSLALHAASDIVREALES